MRITTTSVEETRRVGADLAGNAGAGDVFALIGGLGAGKTEFVRGFVAALSNDAPVRSPTFTLVNTYKTPVCPVHHFDFYRLCDESELIEIGFGEYLADGAVCLVEWADMFPDVLPENTRRIEFSEGDSHSRVITISD